MARAFLKSGLSLRGRLSLSALSLLCVAGHALAQVPAAPSLTAPAEEASRIQSTTFTWGAVAGATSYHIQVSGAYNFGTTIVNDSSLTNPEFASPVFNPRTVYFWRVRGKNASGVSNWSVIRTFTTIVPLPEPDSAGWIRLFRGTNTSDFFSAPNNSTPPGRTLTTFPASPYTVTGDTIRVSGSPAGQFYFKQAFSHYKIRYQIRFPNFTGTNNGGTGNCGMLLHVQAHDNPTNGFPRSVEAQGDPTQGMGQLWAIGDVWVDVRARTVSGRRQYDSTQPEIVHGGLNWNSESRVTVGVNGWALPTFASVQEGGWATMEAHVYGSDSIIHLVNGVPRIKYRNPRVSAGGTADNVTKYLTRGLIAWQSEGTQVWYRNIEIQLLPGDPLYVTTSIAGSAARAVRKTVEVPRLNLDAASPSVLLPDGAGAAKKFDMRGRHRGATEIPSVNKTAE
jgi:Domain of Unknown Function (DUF1080)